MNFFLSTFFATSDASLLADYFLGKESAATEELECRLPGVLRERGKSTCSFIRSQFITILFLSVFCSVKLILFLTLLYSKYRLQCVSSWAQKIQAELGVQYIFNYLDSCAFKILLDAFVTLLYGRLDFATKGFSIFLFEKILAGLTIILILALITLSIYSIRKIGNSKFDKSSTSIQTAANHVSRLQLAIISSFTFCTESSVFIKGYIGQYLLPSLQLKALLCAIILTSLQYHPLIHILSICVIQLLLLAVCTNMNNFRVKRDWTITMIVQIGLLVCCILSTLLYNPSLFSPRSTHFYIGIPITTIIFMIFTANFYNTIYTSVIKIREKIATMYLKNKKTNIIQLDSESGTGIISSRNKINIKKVASIGHSGDKKIRFRKLGDIANFLNPAVRELAKSGVSPDPILSRRGEFESAVAHQKILTTPHLNNNTY